MTTKITTTDTADEIYVAMRAAGITSTGSGDYKDMRTNETAHVFDDGEVRTITCDSPGIAEIFRSALNG